ncbi:MAG: FtsX-like permease family protein [Bacteroidetes bacterium]|nr:FtsX-like permease family protein [Bacteroidota bacterium]MCL1969127.1 FtsX-like permease family protein [Bacteroidota bacterium]
MNLFVLSKVLLKSEQSNYSKPVVKIAVAGVALGVMLMLLALFITAGYKKEIRNKMVSLGAHIRISSVEQNFSFDLLPFDRTQSFVNELSKNPHIKNMQFYATKVGILKTQDQVEGIVLKGIDSTFSWDLFSAHIISGNLPVYYSDSVSNKILISKTLASKLRLQVGDKVGAYFVQTPPRQRSFIIEGIYQTDLPEMDNRFVLSDLRHVQKLNDWTPEQVSGIEILIDDYNQLDLLGEQIHSEIPYNLKAATIKQLYPNIFEWLALSDTNAIVLLIITIIVCIITMISTFFIIVLEQTKNIGILKTMGLNHKRIVKLFLIIASQLILRGLCWGNILGIGTGILQTTLHLIPLDSSTYYVSYIPIAIHPLTLLWVNLLVFCACILTLLLPAYYISKRISPIDAIRFD